MTSCPCPWDSQSLRKSQPKLHIEEIKYVSMAGIYTHSKSRRNGLGHKILSMEACIKSLKYDFKKGNLSNITCICQI